MIFFFLSVFGLIPKTNCNSDFLSYTFWRYVSSFNSICLVVFSRRRGYRCRFDCYPTKRLGRALIPSFKVALFYPPPANSARYKDKASSMASIEITGNMKACILAGDLELKFPVTNRESSSSSLSPPMYLLRNHRALKFKNPVLRPCNVIIFEYPFPSSSHSFIFPIIVDNLSSAPHPPLFAYFLSLSLRFLALVNLLTFTAPTFKNGDFEITLFLAPFLDFGVVSAIHFRVLFHLKMGW